MPFVSRFTVVLCLVFLAGCASFRPGTPSLADLIAGKQIAGIELRHASEIDCDEEQPYPPQWTCSPTSPDGFRVLSVSGFDVTFPVADRVDILVVERGEARDVVAVTMTPRDDSFEDSEDPSHQEVAIDHERPVAVARPETVPAVEGGELKLGLFELRNGLIMEIHQAPTQSWKLYSRSLTRIIDRDRFWKHLEEAPSAWNHGIYGRYRPWGPILAAIDASIAALDPVAARELAEASSRLVGDTPEHLASKIDRAFSGTDAQLAELRARWHAGGDLGRRVRVYRGTRIMLGARAKRGEALDEHVQFLRTMGAALVPELEAAASTAEGRNELATAAAWLLTKHWIAGNKPPTPRRLTAAFDETPADDAQRAQQLLARLVVRYLPAVEPASELAGAVATLRETSRWAKTPLVVVAALELDARAELDPDLVALKRRSSLPVLAATEVRQDTLAAETVTVTAEQQQKDAAAWRADQDASHRAQMKSQGSYGPQTVYKSNDREVRDCVTTHDGHSHQTHCSYHTESRPGSVETIYPSEPEPVAPEPVTPRPPPSGEHFDTYSYQLYGGGLKRQVLFDGAEVAVGTDTDYGTWRLFTRGKNDYERRTGGWREPALGDLRAEMMAELDGKIARWLDPQLDRALDASLDRHQGDLGAVRYFFGRHVAALSERPVLPPSAGPDWELPPAAAERYVATVVAAPAPTATEAEAAPSAPAPGTATQQRAEALERLNGSYETLASSTDIAWIVKAVVSYVAAIEASAIPGDAADRAAREKLVRKQAERLFATVEVGVYYYFAIEAVPGPDGWWQRYAAWLPRKAQGELQELVEAEEHE